MFIIKKTIILVYNYNLININYLKKILYIRFIFSINSLVKKKTFKCFYDFI